MPHLAPVATKIDPPKAGTDENDNNSSQMSFHGAVAKAVPVPEPDVQAALRSIENCARQLAVRAGAAATTSSRKTTSVSATPREGGECDRTASLSRDPPSAAEAERALYVDLVADSLRAGIERVVSPIPVEEYNAILRSHSVHDDAELDDDTSSCSSEEEMKEEEEDPEGEAESDDEKDLLDLEALSRARALRDEVRIAASRVTEVRRSVLDRAMRLAQIEVDISRVQERRESGADEELDEGNEFDQREYEERFARDTATEGDGGGASDDPKVDEMKTSFLELMKALDDVDADLPDKVENLQETVEIVENTLDKRRRHRKGGEDGDKVLSATEAAMLSRTNEGNRKKKGGEGNGSSDEEEDSTEVVKALPPEQRFQLFMSQM